MQLCAAFLRLSLNEVRVVECTSFNKRIQKFYWAKEVASNTIFFRADCVYWRSVSAVSKAMSKKNRWIQFCLYSPNAVTSTHHIAASIVSIVTWRVINSDYLASRTLYASDITR
jgi:hypothetical protein